MIYRNVCYWVHRQLYLGFIAMSCMLITAEIEATDGSWIRLYLKLYPFEEFLDFMGGKRSLDKATLLRATNHLRDNAKYRTDYLALKIREARWDECATEDELVWPAAEADKQALMQGSHWETSFEGSRFATTTIFNWVAGDFLKSAMMFPLCATVPYTDMHFYATHVRMEGQFIYINLGNGFVRVRNYAKYLNRKKKEAEPPRQSQLLIDRFYRLRDTLGTHRDKEIFELPFSVAVCGLPADEPVRKKRKGNPLVAQHDLLIRDQ